MAEPNVPQLRRRALLGCAVESGLGVDGTSSITTPMAATQVYNANVVPLDQFAKRGPDGNYLGSVDNVRVGDGVRLTFTTQLAAGDAVLTLLRGCAWHNATGYKPTSNFANRITLSFNLWRAGKVVPVYGAAGTFNFRGQARGIVEIDWDFMGRIGVISDAALPSLSPQTALPFVSNGIQHTIATAVPPMFSAWSLSAGNTVSPRLDGNSSGGCLHYFVSEYAPTMTFDYEARLAAQLDAWGAFAAGTTVALGIVLTRGANTLTIAAPRAQRSALEFGEREGLLTEPVTWDLHNSSGDDSLIFVYA